MKKIIVELNPGYQGTVKKQIVKLNSRHPGTGDLVKKQIVKLISRRADTGDLVKNSKIIWHNF